MSLLNGGIGADGRRGSNVIADAVAFKHDWCRWAAPDSMIPEEKAHSGIFPGCRKNTAQKGKLGKEKVKLWKGRSSSFSWSFAG